MEEHAFEAQGRIGVVLDATEFPVVPGDSVTIPLVLANRGLESDTFALSVDGIPSTWVYTSSATVPLSPGQEREVSLTVQPPRSLQAGAGRQPFRILVASQAAPGQAAVAECTLVIASTTEFRSELRSGRIEAGDPARVTVQNLGNIQQAFTLTWQSPNDELAFEPGPTQELRVSPGELAMAEFTASPRQRPFFGGEVTYPFVTRVQSADMKTQNLSGEVVGRALIPSWLLPAALLLIAVVACFAILLVVLGGGGSDVAPTDVPVEQPTGEVEQPAPTEPPAVPTEAPPEQPTEPPPEQPTEAPPPEEPTEPPPEAGHLPAEPPDEGSEDTGGGTEEGQPCASLGFGLVLAPLWVMRKKGRR